MRWMDDDQIGLPKGAGGTLGSPLPQIRALVEEKSDEAEDHHSKEREHHVRAEGLHKGVGEVLAVAQLGAGAPVQRGVDGQIDKRHEREEKCGPVARPYKQEDWATQQGQSTIETAEYSVLAKIDAKRSDDTIESYADAQKSGSCEKDCPDDSANRHLLLL